MIDDLNMVEDATNRLPPHPNAPHTVKAFHNLKNKLGLTDGWQCKHPYPDHGFTFEQPSGSSRSLIDRIYVTEDLLIHTLDWKIEQPDIFTDHQLISVHLYDLSIPHIRRGRW